MRRCLLGNEEAVASLLRSLKNSRNRRRKRRGKREEGAGMGTEKRPSKLGEKPAWINSGGAIDQKLHSSTAAKIKQKWKKKA